MCKTSYSSRYLCLHYNWKCTKFFYGVLFIAPKVDELVFEPSQYCNIVWIVHYHLWPEWWGKIGRKGCVNQDGCIMHEWGARRPTTEDDPSLAPSVPLSYALTILGIRHQWHCSFLKVDSDRDGKSLAQPSWKVRYVNVQFCESEKLEKWWQNLNLNWAIEQLSMRASFMCIHTYVLWPSWIYWHQCIVL